MTSGRSDEAAIAWAEQLLGGKAIRKEQHIRWRPQWFVDIETPDGTVKKAVLRGYRAVSALHTSEQMARDFLAHETDILSALQDLPVNVPRLYGFNQDLGWMLSEFVEGEVELTELADTDRRFTIFQSYLEQLAQLHAYPLDQIKLPSGLHKPTSSKSFRTEIIAKHIAEYRALKRTQPEPIMELGIQWLGDNEPTSDRPLSLCLIDVGPNQFTFTGTECRTLLDFEYGLVADPLMEIGMMRRREVQYPIGRMAEHVLHYGKHYEALTGIPLDLDAVRYWTVASQIIWHLTMIPGTNYPNPNMTDLVFVYAYEAQGQRAQVEATAEYYNLRLTAPEIPPEVTTMLDPLYRTMIGQIEKHFAPHAKDPLDELFATFSASLARTLARGNASSGRIYQDNLEELAEILGHRPRDWTSGLYELEQLINEDYARDLENRLNFLYRVEMRREYLYGPMQRATGCGSGSPLWRMEEAPGIAASRMPLPLPR